MTERTECRNCHSRDVMPQVRLVAREHNNMDARLMAVVYEHPAAWLFKGARRAKLYGRVCGQCGFVELYVEKPEELYAAYQRAGQ